MADRVGRLLMLLATFLLFFTGLLPILYFSPRKGAFDTLSGMGSFTAGAWALGAGVLAVFAAWSISDREREQRRKEVADQEYIMAQANEVFDRQERTLNDLVGLETKYKQIIEALKVVVESR